MVRLLLLREKKAGHINQVEGLAVIAGGLVPCEIARLDVRPKWWAHAAVRNAFLRHVPLTDKAAVRRAARRVYGIDFAALTKPDIVVGSGRPATALGIWLKAWFGARHIFSGHASGPLTETIDLQLVNSPRVTGPANVALSPVPGKIDADDYPPPRPLRTVDDLHGASLSLILGGNSHSHKFSSAEWAHLEPFLREMWARFGVVWRVTNSRRSPPELAPLFERLGREGVVAEFVDFAKAGLSSAKALFGADVLLVTEDSLSMLSEGLAAGRPVVALRPKKTKRSEFTETVAYQIGQGWLSSLPIGAIDADMFAATLFGLRLPEWTVKGVIAGKIAPFLKAAD
jgi:mitochondrial fission protein ELM1